MPPSWDETGKFHMGYIPVDDVLGGPWACGIPTVLSVYLGLACKLQSLNVVCCGPGIYFVGRMYRLAVSSVDPE